MHGERRIHKVGDRIAWSCDISGESWCRGTVKEIDEANSRALIQWDDGFADSWTWIDSGLIAEVNGEQFYAKEE